ncbi:MAG: hypothetical protein JWN08_637 [Frankiales bacterium]|nr:hypothetical protein [Frankiales bacterium]
MTPLDALRADGGYERWSQRTDGPLLVLGLVFLAAFVVPLYRPDLPAGALVLGSALSLLVWVAF